jgi:gliding motility-associated-like protein
VKERFVLYFLWFAALPFTAQVNNFLPDTVRLCAGDTTALEIKRVLAQDVGVTWTTPYGIITNTKRVRASREGKYLLRITGTSISTLSDSCFVKFIPRPRKTLRDTFFCRGRSVILSAANSGMKYSWNTNETSQKIKVQSPGIYSVRIFNGACFATDSAQVGMLAGPQSPTAQDYTFCVNDDGRQVGVRALPGVQFIWNTGATTPSISPGREGVYWVRSTFPQCGDQTDTFRVKLKMCECEMIIPNSFTPNEDGKNDYFFPVMQCDYSHFFFTITDRWGNLVYNSNSPSGRWDGRFKGNLCPEDIYIYKIETIEKAGEKKQVRTGHISLFR